MNAIGRPMNRETATAIIGYPDCVNETYGLMSADCMIKAFEKEGIVAKQAWVTFEQAYSICQKYTGVINPIGQYHFMGIRGVEGSTIWVANSAQGYMGVWDNLDYERFIGLGPVQVIYCESYG
jgi:hypothetical protein